MTDTREKIKQIEKELEALPVGYISRKIISGKERFYLQWMENGKVNYSVIESPSM